MRLILLIFLLGFTAIHAAEIKSIEWETKHAAPPAILPAKQQKLLPTIRRTVATIPEPMLMQMAGTGGKMLGLPEKLAKQINKLIGSYYKGIAADMKHKKFPAIPSALGYCFSEKRPTKGFANLYLPDGADKNTPVIVFIHGYGGSFQFYLHYFATTFPDHIILCPAYGISTANISDRYLAESLTAAEKTLKFKPQKPTLIGLSAGGTGGFRHYQRRTKHYRRYICLVSYPPFDVINKMPENASIRLLAGGTEGYVRSGILKQRATQLKRRVKDYQQTIIKDHGHFLILSDKENSQKILRKYVLLNR